MPGKIYVIHCAENGGHDGQEAERLEEKGRERLLEGVRGDQWVGGVYDARSWEVSRLLAGRV